MIKKTPFHDRLEQLNTTHRWGHWSGYLSALRYDMSRQARVLRGPQQRRLLRHVAAVQVLDPRPRRRAVPRRRDDPRHPARAGPAGRSTPSGATTAASCSRTASLFRHSATDFMLTAAEPNLGYFSDLIGRLRGDDRGRHRRVRDARGPGASLTRDPRDRSHPRSSELAFFEHHRHQDRQCAGDDLAHRLHRRPRLRGPRRRRDDALGVLDAVHRGGTGPRLAARSARRRC